MHPMQLPLEPPQSPFSPLHYDPYLFYFHILTSFIPVVPATTYRPSPNPRLFTNLQTQFNSALPKSRASLSLDRI